MFREILEKKKKQLRKKIAKTLLSVILSNLPIIMLLIIGATGVMGIMSLGDAIKSKIGDKVIEVENIDAITIDQMIDICNSDASFEYYFSNCALTQKQMKRMLTKIKDANERASSAVARASSCKVEQLHEYLEKETKYLGFYSDDPDDPNAEPYDHYEYIYHQREEYVDTDSIAYNSAAWENLYTIDWQFVYALVCLQAASGDNEWVIQNEAEDKADDGIKAYCTDCGNLLNGSGKCPCCGYIEDLSKVPGYIQNGYCGECGTQKAGGSCLLCDEGHEVVKKISNSEIDELLEKFIVDYDYAYDVTAFRNDYYDYDESQSVPFIYHSEGSSETEEGRYIWFEPASIIETAHNGFMYTYYDFQKNETEDGTNRTNGNGMLILGDSRACGLTNYLLSEPAYQVIEDHRLSADGHSDRGWIAFRNTSDDSVIVICQYGGGSLGNGGLDACYSWAEQALYSTIGNSTPEWVIFNMFGIGDVGTNITANDYLSRNAQFNKKLSTNMKFIQCTIGPIDETASGRPLQWTNSVIQQFNSNFKKSGGVYYYNFASYLRATGVGYSDSSGVHYDNATNKSIISILSKRAESYMSTTSSVKSDENSVELVNGRDSTIKVYKLGAMCTTFDSGKFIDIVKNCFDEPEQFDLDWVIEELLQLPNGEALAEKYDALMISADQKISGSTTHGKDVYIPDGDFLTNVKTQAEAAEQGGFDEELNSFEIDYNGNLSEQFAKLCMSKVGCKYTQELGKNNGPNSFDCSGLVQWGLKQFGVSVTENWNKSGTGRETGRAWAQAQAYYKSGRTIAKSDLKPGDLIYFNTTGNSANILGNVSHVGIYLGNNKFVHAANKKPYPQGGVKTDSLSGYWEKKIVMCARGI